MRIQMGDIKIEVQKNKKSIFQATNMLGKDLSISRKTKAPDYEGNL